MSAIAWALLVLGALLSVLSLNPVPFGLCLVAALVGTGATAQDAQAVREAGRHPDLPPPPTDGVGVMGCFLRCILWGFLLTVAIVGVFGLTTVGVGGVR